MHLNKLKLIEKVVIFVNINNTYILKLCLKFVVYKGAGFNKGHICKVK